MRVGGGGWYGISDPEEGRWFRIVTKQIAMPGMRGIQDPKGGAWIQANGRMGRPPDVHNLRNDITLGLKRGDMAFFKSDLGPIYISEQTAYCFHQGEISTHVYLMFPSKYLHFKAF